MSAKEMFEELGYEEKTNVLGLYYYKFSSKHDKDNYSGQDWEHKIKFDNYSKGIYSDKFFNIQLLQAINKQVEELGWNNEK